MGFDLDASMENLFLTEVSELETPLALPVPEVVKKAPEKVQLPLFA